MPTVFSTMNLFHRDNAVTQCMAQRGLHGECLRSGKRRLTPAEMTGLLLERAAEIEYLIIDTTPLPREFFAKATALKLVAMHGVGLDHIDMAAATECGVLVTNAPGMNSTSVAELVLGLMFSLARCLPQAHAGVISGTWHPKMGMELRGKTLGVLGLGAIGTEVARLGKGIGMAVIAHNRSPKPEVAAALGLSQLSFEELLRQSDILSLHIPGGSAAPAIGAAELALMKPGALLINTGRGSLVDLDALAESLSSGHLGGAGLDVFPQEPIDVSHPLFRLSNIVCTPHIGAFTTDASLRVFQACIDAVTATVNGEQTVLARNPEVYVRAGTRL